MSDESDEASENRSMSCSDMIWEAGDDAGLGALAEARNDEEKSNVGRTNDWEGSILSISIPTSDPRLSPQSTELDPSSLPMSEEAEDESEDAPESDSDRTS